MKNNLFMKNGRDYCQLFFSEILYIETKYKYSRLVTVKRKYLTLQTFNVIVTPLLVFDIRTLSTVIMYTNNGSVRSPTLVFWTMQPILTEYPQFFTATNLEW